MTHNNLLLMSDAYKYCHFNLLPDGTDGAHLYVEARGGSYKETVFFSLQYLLKEYLTTPFVQADIDEAKEVCAGMGIPFNEEGFTHVLNEHGGLFPIHIRAVPEGSVVPTGNVLMTIESTCSKCFWVPGFLETLLLKVWYGTTVASRSRHIRSILMDALEQSSDDPASEIDFKLHAFGYRGVSSEESACVGGAAELIHFKGTDTIRGLLCARDYYHGKNLGYSVPATEHSVITAYGKEHEEDAYKKLLAIYAKPGTIVSCVSDSTDLHATIRDIWCGSLKEQIIKSDATLVIRLDSGEPIPNILQALAELGEGFGFKDNTKGFRVLNHVRILQGDGINEVSVRDIADAALKNKWSMTNFGTLGCGGGMVQQLDRDTCRFACKMSAVRINGKWQDVSKDPATDHSKASKPGRLDLVNDNGVLKTVKLEDGFAAAAGSVMRSVFVDGKLLVDDTFDEIRARAKGDAV